MTDPLGRTPRPGFESRVPRTAAEFAQRFLESRAGQDNRDDMDAYQAEFVGKPDRAIAYKQSARAEHAKTQTKKSPYTISIFMQARAVMLRRLQILRGSMAKEVIQIAYVSPLACILYDAHSLFGRRVARSSYRQSSSEPCSTILLSQPPLISLVEVFCSCACPPHSLIHRWVFTNYFTARSCSPRSRQWLRSLLCSPNVLS